MNPSGLTKPYHSPLHIFLLSEYLFLFIPGYYNKHHRLVVYIADIYLFLTDLEAEKFNIKVLANVVPGKSHFSVLQTSSICVLTWWRRRALVSSFSHKDMNAITKFHSHDLI